jgi:hypothetical protein
MHLSRLLALGPGVVRPGKLKLELVLTLGVTLLENDIMEHIIHSTVMKHLDMYDILIDAQHGFRKSRSCESHLINTVPWGTSDVTSDLEECFPSSTTSCF